MTTHDWTILGALFAGQIVGTLTGLWLHAWWTARRERTYWTAVSELRYVGDTYPAASAAPATCDEPHNDSIDIGEVTR